MKTMTFTALIHKEDGFYSAKCAEVGTESQGATKEEAIDKLREATEIYVSLFPERNIGNPIIETFEANVKEPA